MKIITFSVFIFYCACVVHSNAFANETYLFGSLKKTLLLSGLNKLKHLVTSLKSGQNNDAWTNGTKLTDLNVDCQLMIFEQLNLPSLLALAEVNQAFSVLTADVFRRNYGYKTIEIRKGFSSDDMNIFEFEETIQVENFGLISTIFKHFGQFISSVKINYGKCKKSQLKEIITFVNRNSNSLKKLQLEMYEDVLDGIEKPFINVEDVSFVGEYKRLGNKQLSLSEIFPKMRRLSLEYVKVINRKSIALEIPTLEHLHVAFLHPNGFTEKDIKK